MALISQEQLTHYVVGEILDELAYYDCSELFWSTCCVVVRNAHKKHGSFDINQEGTFPKYQELFFEALEIVRILADAERGTPTA